MLVKNITTILALAATLFDLTTAKKGKGNNPGPTCGAPFCNRHGAQVKVAAQRTSTIETSATSVAAISVASAA
jgi:hypothetical protein